MTPKNKSQHSQPDLGTRTDLGTLNNRKVLDTNRLVLHFKNQAITTRIDHLPALRDSLRLSFAYVEMLGEIVYNHYDVLAVRRVKRA